MGVAGFVNGLTRALRSVNCDGRWGAALLGCWALLLLPALAGEPGRLQLRYDRTGLAHGEWWRLLSAHVVHLNARHALINCVGLTLMWALFAREYSAGRWLAVVLAAALAIDAGLWLVDSTVPWYVGSSGALHGVMAAGVIAQLRRREASGSILAALLIAKLAYEHWVGALPLSGSGHVVVDAHLYGVIGGAATAAFLRPQGRQL